MPLRLGETTRMVEADCRSIALWSMKAGSGTTTVAALLARRLADVSDVGAILVDLCGEATTAQFGDMRHAESGAAEWSRSDSQTADGDALSRAEMSVATSLRLLPRGDGPFRDGDRVGSIANLLGKVGRPSVVDAGCLHRPGGDTGTDPQDDDLAARRCAAAAADWSLLVTRNCPVALRRAALSPLVPDGVVVIVDQHSPLTAEDVERSVGAPVWLCLDVDPSIARAVDAGLLGVGLPAATRRALEEAVPSDISAGMTL